MEECGRQNLTKREVELLQRFRSRLKEIEDEAISRDIVGRDTNKLDFYRITPKEELPIYLQKMRFQTLHLKESTAAPTKKISPAPSRSLARRTETPPKLNSGTKSNNRDNSCYSPKCSRHIT